MADPTIWFILSGVAIGGVWGVCGVILWRVLMKRLWPMEIPVAMQRGKSVVWDLAERAKHVMTKDGSEVVRLKRRKRNIKPPKFDNLSVNTKGKAVYPIYETTRGQFFPVKLMDPPSFKVIEDKSSKNWGITERNRLWSVYRPKESTFMRLLPYLMNATFAAMVIFFVIYFGGKMEIVASSMSGAANSLTTAVQAMG